MEDPSSNISLTKATSFLNQSATLQMEFGQAEESLDGLGLMAAQIHGNFPYQPGMTVSFCNTGYLASGKQDLPRVWVNGEVHIT